MQILQKTNFRLGSAECAAKCQQLNRRPVLPRLFAKPLWVTHCVTKFQNDHESELSSDQPCLRKRLGSHQCNEHNTITMDCTGRVMSDYIQCLFAFLMQRQRQSSSRPDQQPLLLDAHQRHASFEHAKSHSVQTTPSHNLSQFTAQTSHSHPCDDLMCRLNPEFTKTLCSRVMCRYSQGLRLVQDVATTTHKMFPQ